MQRFKLSSLQIQRSHLYSFRNLHCYLPKLFSQQQQQTPLENVGPICSHLKSRSVIKFQGPDTIKFLQGLLTNDVRRFAQSIAEKPKTSNFPTPNVSPVSEPPMYAAMLTPQGRFLYDFFLYRPWRPEEKLDTTGAKPGEEGFALFADVDFTVLDEILECLRKYRLRSKVEIENVGNDYACWQRFGGQLSSKSSSTEDPKAASIGWGGAINCAGMSATQGNHLGWQWYNDPRLETLGFRGIFPSNTIPPLVEADKEADERNYLLWRLEKGVAEGSTEIPKGEAIPLEYNMVGLNAISFDKGCYVGQEFVARTHHRGVIRKRLLPLKFANGSGKEVVQKVTPGSEIVDTTSNKKVGTVTTALGSRGLGLLRLEEAFNASGTLSIKDQDNVKIEVIRPDWWPTEWFPERQNHTSAA